MTDIAAVKTAWNDFCAAMGVPRKLWDPIFEKISKQYETPLRYYHNLVHIALGLPDLQAVKKDLRYPRELFYSWLLHDGIYIAGAGDNEIRTVEFASELAIELGLSNPFRHRTSRLIMLSDGHNPPNDIEGKAQIDLDLAIFGQDEETFAWYDDAIWEEWKEVVDRQRFCAGRANLLERFSRRKPLYAVPYFQKKYTEQAEKNLARAIARLRQEIV